MSTANADKKSTGIIDVVVPEDIRALVETEAKSLCEEREVEYSALTQGMTAIVAARALKNIGANFDKCGKDKKEAVAKVFAILKVTANASALKQAIDGSRKKSAKVIAVDESLL